MTAITISRQLGSQGLEVARACAGLLGFEVVWREVINQAALRSGAPEMALAAIDELGLLKLNPAPEASRAYHAAVQQVVTELADQGSIVILGRAGQVILRGRADVLHVRILAPLEVRVQRLSKLRNISQTAAQAQIKASDRHRKAYLKQHYQVDWNDPELYDLIINTAHLPPQTAAALIAEAARQLPAVESSVVSL